jgi:hypothetical protein
VASAQSGDIAFTCIEGAPMAQLLHLPDRGLKNVAARRPSGPPKPLAANNYYCIRCVGDHFLLYPGGAVQCTDCGAKMENLGVTEC